MDQIKEFLHIIWSKYIASYEGVATLMAVLVITLKLVVNQRVTNIQFKKAIISVPSEITSLVMGFLLSAMVTASATNIELIALIMTSFFVIVVQYSFERCLDDKLSGHLKPTVLLWIVAMYIVSVILYHEAVFGGAANGPHG